MLTLVVGVNGVGKTTSIAKLAKRHQRQGDRVMLAATGDRAEALEAQVARRRQQLPVQFALQRDRRDEFEWIAARRDEGGVQAADGAEGNNLGGGLKLA